MDWTSASPLRGWGPPPQRGRRFQLLRRCKGTRQSQSCAEDFGPGTQLCRSGAVFWQMQTKPMKAM
jgi:hypothetical protein